MPKIKEIFKIGIKEPYVISFSTKFDKFVVDIPDEIKSKYGKRSQSMFDTYKNCIDEINNIHDTVMQEEILLRKVIYITMQTNYDIFDDKKNSNSQSGSQGFKWCWFVLDEYQVGSKLMYKVIKSSKHARIHMNDNKINILPQLMFMYNDGKIIMLDYSDAMLDKVIEIEDNLESSIIKIQSFFNVDNDLFKNNLLSISDKKLLG